MTSCLSEVFSSARKKSANLVCQQKAVQNNSLVVASQRKNVTEKSSAYMDGVELERLDEEDVHLRCTPQAAPVSRWSSKTPIIPLGRTVNHWGCIGVEGLRQSK